MDMFNQKDGRCVLYEFDLDGLLRFDEDICGCATTSDCADYFGINMTAPCNLLFAEVCFAYSLM